MPDLMLLTHALNDSHLVSEAFQFLEISIVHIM